MSFKITDLPVRFIRFDKMTVFKRLLNEKQYKFLCDRLREDAEYWGSYLKHNPLDEFFVGILNKDGVDYLYNSSVHRNELDKWELDLIDLSFECDLPFLLGYVVLETDKQLNKYNRNNRYIKVISTNIKKIWVATSLINKYEKKIKRDLFPLGIIEPSFHFWGNWFNKKYGLKRLHQFIKFIDRTGHNLSYDINYNKFLNFIEIRQEKQENCEMGMEDLRL